MMYISISKYEENEWYLNDTKVTQIPFQLNLNPHFCFWSRVNIEMKCFWTKGKHACGALLDLKVIVVCIFFIVWKEQLLLCSTEERMMTEYPHVSSDRANCPEIDQDWWMWEETRAGAELEQKRGNTSMHLVWIHTHRNNCSRRFPNIIN